jgi:hypothetical protein
MNRSMRVAVVFLALALPFVLAHAADEEAGSLWDAVTDGRLLLNLRPRYEHVEQDGKTYDANALTLRTLLGWQTAPYHGFSATAQMIDVGRANENYNERPATTTGRRAQFPVVADPDDTDINQLFLDYTHVPATRLRLGKQSIKLDNVRFVGNVEFRQVMQVFTGLTAENKGLPKTTIYAGHLERLKTIFTTQQAIKLEVLNVAYEWTPGNKLIGYGYLLDSPKTSSVTGFTDNSNRILGLRADGGYPLGENLKLLYTVEYARQNDYAGGDSRIDADYVHGGIGLGWPAFHVRIDYELLSSNDGVYAFQTPLGTNHLFQGWADLFLTTPAQGMRDTFLTVGGSMAKAKWSAEYHDFKSDFGSLHYGTEFDVGVTHPLFVKGLSAKVEYARFREDDVLTPATARKRDTDKFWLTFLYNFE